MQPERPIPPWFRCDVCHRNRAGHDRANQKVAEPYRHEWITALDAARRLARERAHTPLVAPETIRPREQETLL